MTAVQEPSIPLTELSAGSTAERDGSTDAAHLVDEEPDISYPQGSKFYLVFFSLGLMLVLGGLDLNVVGICTVSITDHFHTVSDVGWYSAGYRLMPCSFTFFFGKLYKIFRVEAVFISSIVIFLFGSVLCASASSSKMFVLGRCVCGLGNAGSISGGFIIITYILPPHKRPLWASLLNMFEAVASIAGPLLGGILVEKLSWRWCFWISLPIGGITLVVLVLFLRIPPTVQTERPTLTWREILYQLDPVGTLVFVPSMTSLFLALGWAGITYPWSDPKVIGLLVTFLVLFALFAFDQYKRQDEAVLPPRILKQRRVIAAVIFSFFCNSTLEIIAYYMPTYFQEVKNYSPGKSGFLMIPMIVGAIAATLAYGTSAVKVGYINPFMILGSILMPVAAGLMVTWKVETPLAELMVYSTFMGFASCLAIMAPQSAVQNYLPLADVPLGIAVVFFAHNFGPALAISIAQTIFTNRLVSDLQGVIPGLNATTINTVGLGELVDSVRAQSLGQALFGIDKALIQTWYLVIALGALSMTGSLLMTWEPIKQKKT